MVKAATETPSVTEYILQKLLSRGSLLPEARTGTGGARHTFRQ